MSVIISWAALIVWFSNATTRSGRVRANSAVMAGCGLGGQVAEIEPEVLAFFVAQRREPVAQAVERRRHMIEAYVKEGDSVDPGLLCLGGERRGEETGERNQEDPPVHYSMT
jgi:hypothetical protein